MDRDRLRFEPDALIALRLRARLSIAEVARATGLSMGTISNLERGLSKLPRMETFRRLADYFGVHYSAFVAPPSVAAVIAAGAAAQAREADVA